MRPLLVILVLLGASGHAVAAPVIHEAFERARSSLDVANQTVATAAQAAAGPASALVATAHEHVPSDALTTLLCDDRPFSGTRCDLATDAAALVDMRLSHLGSTLEDMPQIARAHTEPTFTDATNASRQAEALAADAACPGDT